MVSSPHPTTNERTSSAHTSAEELALMVVSRSVNAWISSGGAYAQHTLKFSGRLACVASTAKVDPVSLVLGGQPDGVAGFEVTMNPASRVQDLQFSGNVDEELHAVHGLPTCFPRNVAC
jgi:hypothetical protein